MKRTLLIFSVLAAQFSFGQTVHRCLTHEATEYQEGLTPGYINQLNKVFEAAKLRGAQMAKSNALYTIPVVVHVVYNTAAQNIPDSVIFDQIRILNEDYQRLNADTVNMRSDFEPVKGSPQIEFMLAQIDENGQPTTGITRTATSTQTFGSLLIFAGDFTDLEKVKSTANGGQDPWDQTRYLNIWVCNMSIIVVGQEINGLLGYATPPDGLPNWPPGSISGLSDGVVIQYQCFGSNNPNPLDMGNGNILDVRGRTPVHEVGHYLGLRHIWGDGDCTAQDGIDDTPNAAAQSNTDCDLNKNTCTDNILGFDLPDMVENYMDYSAETCQNSFTQGQCQLMHGVLENERYDLVHNNPASVKETFFSNLQMYPNPANQEVSISGLNKTADIAFYTPSGALVLSHSAGLETTKVNVANLPQGFYFVRISSEGQHTMRKLVLTR